MLVAALPFAPKRLSLVQPGFRYPILPGIVRKVLGDHVGQGNFDQGNDPEQSHPRHRFINIVSANDAGDLAIDPNAGNVYSSLGEHRFDLSPSLLAIEGKQGFLRYPER